MEHSFLLGNIHCPSCIATIEGLWTSLPLAQDATHLSVSLLTGIVQVTILPTLLPVFLRLLDEAGFEVVSPTTAAAATEASSSAEQGSSRWYETARTRTKRIEAEQELQREREALHRENCRACREGDGGKGKAKECTTIPIGNDGTSTGATTKITTILVGGMTCSSCIGSVQHILAPAVDARILADAIVTLIPGKAVVTHSGIPDKELVEMLEDGGYDAEIVETVSALPAQGPPDGWVESSFVIEGMTCASCVGSLATILKPSDGIRSSQVTLLPARATIVHDPSVMTTDQIIEAIEDGGFGGQLVASKAIDPSKADSGVREVKLRVDGMFCNTCSDSINDLLDSLKATSTIASFTPLSHANPYTTVSYTPLPPSGFTLRTLQSSIGSLGPFTIHPVRASDVLTTLARAAQARESRSILLRLSLAFLFAIPTFIIAIVAMSLLPSSDPLAMFFSTPLWGNASRGTIALFVLSTPVQFGVGSLFYIRAFKSLRGVWKRVFLVLFILAGRWLEGLSRRRTGDAVEALGRMKASTGILFERPVSSGTDDDKKDGYFSEDDSDGDSTSATPAPGPSTGTNTQVVEVDFLEKGDTLLVPAGSSVPLDSIILSTSAISNFDESSLTGESRPVLKGPGDDVFAGSTNLGPSAVVVRVTAPAGETMLDGIVRAVGDAMAKKARIERVADLVTGYFVPVIVGIAGTTFGIWIVRGYSGSLPTSWLDPGGSWALFAVQFAVAVLVVACPCGIGLAAPTAQMVGTGLAAQHGIVPYGEAFQNATQIDCVVFDKTGTLTRGEFKVSAHHFFAAAPLSPQSLFKAILVVEETSSHPISVGIGAFCQAQPPTDDVVHLATAEEVPGKGLSGTIRVGADSFDILIGNERLLEERDTVYSPEARERTSSLITSWANEGNSVVLVAVRPASTAPPSPFVIADLFAVHDPPRDEAPVVILELERQGIAVFLCTGDNPVTALAVARQVGISEERVFAGVLPIGKRDVIEQLQRGAASDAIAAVQRRRSWWRRTFSRKNLARAKVLFVGDGINDIVALTQADVGVSMGTGAAVARTNSDFCLLSSNLLSLITLLALSKATYHKILTNFAWAIFFNGALVPIAAGAFYDLGRTRLPPVWASLAMALSSISVVSSSLLLRYTFKVPKVALPKGA
ncbi:hypothetical protein RQP46_004838 [Phenoliferia psychrophenolica]